MSIFRSGCVPAYHRRPPDPGHAQNVSKSPGGRQSQERVHHHTEVVLTNLKQYSRNNKQESFPVGGVLLA